MKKILLMAAIAVSSIAANAQVWVGGSAGFNYDKHNYGAGDDANSTISVAPEVGYVLDEQWAIAADLDFSYRTGDSPTLTTFGVTPFARYTFFRSGIVSLFVDGGFNVGAEKEEKKDSQVTWGVGVRPGISIAVTPKFSFVTKLGYFGYQNSDLYDRKEFGLGVKSTALSFGLYYNL